MSTGRGARAFRGALVAAVVVVAAGARPAYDHARAAASLVRLVDANAHGGFSDVGRHAVTTADVTIPTDAGPVPGRIYSPADDTAPPAIVLIHGVHRLGIEEPRLKHFAETIASGGVAVLTPEIKELASYAVDESSLVTLAASMRFLRARLALGSGKVGLMGISFGGGLALVAAADPRNANDIGFVASVGAHHDLSRVLRFFATNEIARPDGSILKRKAHDYGPLIVVLGHAEAFFAEADAETARAALRLWLAEQFDAAREAARGLSDDGRKRMDVLFAHDVGSLGPALLAEVARNDARARTVSPSAHMAGIHVPVFVLHGEEDAVIPPSEAQWIGHDTPPGYLRDLLVTGAVSHAEMHGEPTLTEKWALVRFLEQLFEAARDAKAR